jgi:hypothetical protein
MMKRTLSAVTFAAMLAAPAFAQTPAPEAKPNDRSMPALSTPQPQPRDNFVQSEHATDWRGSKLIGAIVYGSDNASIGSVSDVLISNDAKIRAVVIGVGGFLGVGEKNVAVPLDALRITRKPDSNSIDKISVSLSKEELKNAPTFAFNDGLSQTTGSSSVPPIGTPVK